MKILYYPAKSENIYSKICRECIEDAGVHVQLFSKNILSILLSDCDGVYLQWYENLPTPRMKMLRMLVIKLVLLLVFKIKGIHIYFVLHNKSPHDKRIRKYGTYLLKQVLRKADTILIMSHESTNEIKLLLGEEYFNNKKVADKIKFFPHPNYIDEYPVGERKFQNIKSFCKDDFVFMNIGMVRPYKNLEILIKAFTQCNFNRAKLVIVGKPSSLKYKNQIEKLIENNPNIFAIFQFIDDSNMAEMLGYADAMVFPYNKKSCLNSGAIYLSCSYAKTFIAPPMGTTKELRNESSDMYIYDYSDEQMHTDCLSKKMNEVYQDWNTGNEKFYLKGTSLQQLVRRNNNRSVLVKAYKNIFQLQ